MRERESRMVKEARELNARVSRLEEVARKGHPAPGGEAARPVPDEKMREAAREAEERMKRFHETEKKLGERARELQQMAEKLGQRERELRQMEEKLKAGAERLENREKELKELEKELRKKKDRDDGGE